MMIGAHEAARRLGVTPAAMRRWRTLGMGPPYEWHNGLPPHPRLAIAAYVHQPRKPGRPKGSRDSQPRVRRERTE